MLKPTDEQLHQEAVDLDDFERFIHRIRSRSEYRGGPLNTACLIWLGYTDRFGYGVIKEGLLHRRIWKLTYGKTDLHILHKCDNRACWRVDHLFEGTQDNNMQDMTNKGRNNQPKGIYNAKAILSEDNVREIRGLIAEGKLDNKQIGKRFGVTNEAIRLIKIGRNWAHVK